MLKRLTQLPLRHAVQLRLCTGCDRIPRVGVPALQKTPGRGSEAPRLFSTQTRLAQGVQPAEAARTDESSPLSVPNSGGEWTRTLPTVCPGCGAHSQTVDSESAGYYSQRRARKAAQKASRRDVDAVFAAALQRGAIGNPPSAHDTAASSPADRDTAIPSPTLPICDRCHHLLHQSRGQSIVHPSMESIQAIIEESPHRHNHIYHILDAADFPLSLIPNLQHALDLPRLRTKNRRSKHTRYASGSRTAEVSFIITRSDLLAPKKEQVDALMPYLQDVLRDALGRSGRKVRLGNVRCVSAKRGWWTRHVKEEIWERGGAGWMVGKVNVGKSNLFEVVFPKGRAQAEDVNAEKLKAEQSGRGQESLPATAAESPGELAEEMDGSENTTEQPQTYARRESSSELDPDEEPLDELSLLPPPQPETQYPTMPLVSSLPGTTASPIRIPFGSGRGELIDLPGIQRSTLETHVRPEHHKDMMMKARVVPEQHTLRPGQSLLLGGLIRITHPAPPAGENSNGADDAAPAPVILAYPFLPPAFTPHVTGTHKAIAIQTGVHSARSRDRAGAAYTGTVPSIATAPAQRAMQSAGAFRLAWDVTKRRAGPLTDPAAGKQKAAALPFTVYAADVLVEGAGWVELVCQVRKPRRRGGGTDALAGLGDDDAAAADVGGEGVEARVPEVEVVSPEGGYVGVRRPMSAWVVGGKRKKPVRERRARPRQTIGYLRRKEG